MKRIYTFPLLLASISLFAFTGKYDPGKALNELGRQGYASHGELAESLWDCVTGNGTDSCYQSFTPPVLWLYLILPDTGSKPFAKDLFLQLDSGNTSRFDSLAFKQIRKLRQNVLLRYPGALSASFDSTIITKDPGGMNDREEVTPYRMTVFFHDPTGTTFRIIFSCGEIRERWYITEYLFTVI